MINDTTKQPPNKVVVGLRNKMSNIKFQSLVISIIMVLILHVAVVGFVDAESNIFQHAQIIINTNRNSEESLHTIVTNEDDNNNNNNNNNNNELTLPLPILRWAIEEGSVEAAITLNVGFWNDHHHRHNHKKPQLQEAFLSTSSTSSSTSASTSLPTSSSTWGLIRGGRLGRGQDTTVVVNQTVTTETTTTVVVEEKVDVLDIDYTKSPYSFTLFQENDGSEMDPDGIPNRYLIMQNYKRDLAKKAMEHTLQWRRENDIDTILARPHPKFDVCKACFPHYFCGRDESDHVILLQRPGLIDLPFAEANGLSGEDLLYHYVYEMEYLWRILEPHANATMTSIIDLTGLNLSFLTKKELIKVVQLFCSTMDAHFPTRSYKTLLINAPKWFNAIYKLISPLLRESTKQKITILSKGSKTQDETLHAVLSSGCTFSKDGLPQATAEEQEMRDFVVARLLESGMEMQPIIR